MSTELISFTELTSAQANKFVTYNENLRRYEATVRVESRTNSGPPVSPSTGDAYIVDSATGDWASFAVNDIVFYQAGIWKKVDIAAAQEGIRLWVKDENIVVVYDGSSWEAQAANDIGLSALTDNSVPFVSGDTLIEDVNFNYDPGTDTLTVPNLTVTSNLTSIQTTNMEVSDAIISLAKGNATDSLDIGFIGERSTSNIGFIWDESSDEWSFVTTSSTSSDSTVAITDYSNIHAGGAIFDDNVGIGKTPNAKLDVEGTLRVSNGANYGEISRSASGLDIQSFNAQPLRLNPAGNSVDINGPTTITSTLSVTGNVGIGLTPTYKLDVQSTSAAGDVTGLRLYRTTAGIGDNNAILWQSSSLQTASISDEVISGTSGALVFKTSTASTLVEALRIDSSQNANFSKDITSSSGGKIAIGGTPTVAADFSFVDPSNSAAIRVESLAGGAFFQLAGTTGTTGIEYTGGATNSNFYLYDSKAAQYRLYISTNGQAVFGNTTSPNSSAQLEVSSTTRGFLPPRMTTTQRDAISSPAAGLVIYNTTTNVLNFYNGSVWGAV